MLTFNLADPAGLGGDVLHPQLAADLQQTRENPMPKMWEMPIDLVRAQSLRDAQAQNNAHAPRVSAEILEVDLPVAPARVRARLYIPPVAQPHPLWLYFHGGGFVLGSFADFTTPYHRISLDTPCAILSVDYRLAPEHPFPAAVEDCIASYRWVLENSQQLGVDPARVAVGGDSAGGNLAAAVCLAARERGLPQPALQVLIYPVVDLSEDTWESYDRYTDFGLSGEDMLWFRDQYLPPGEDGRNPLASPLHAGDFSELAPALIQTAEFDVLRDEAEEYARRLANAGVPVTCSRYLGATHGFALWTYDLARHAQDEIITHLRRRLALTAGS